MYKIQTLYFFLSLFMILGFSGCNKGSDQVEDPKRRLTEYISRSFSIREVEDKELLMPYLTGDVRARLASWSNDQFQEAFVDSKREFLKLSFKEVKAISPAETEITYEISFLDFGKVKDKKKHESKITTKKLCRMVFQENQWVVSEVRNIKELVEFKDELSLP